MTFFEFLEKIRNKPKYVRIQILIVCVFLSMSLIVTLWVDSLKGRFSSVRQEQASISEGLAAPFKQAKKEIPTLKKALGDLLGAFSSDKEEMQEKEAIDYEVVEENQEEEEQRPLNFPLRP